jgi:hypothetical protein
MLIAGQRIIRKKVTSYKIHILAPQLVIDESYKLSNMTAIKKDQGILLPDKNTKALIYIGTCF